MLGCQETDHLWTRYPRRTASLWSFGIPDITVVIRHPQTPKEFFHLFCKTKKLIIQITRLYYTGLQHVLHS